MIVDGIEARIAARLRQRREELGISLAELANRSSVSKAMIGKVENGVCCPTAGLLGRLCSGLGVTLSTLMLSVEDAGLDFYPASSQPTWRDPETRLSRTVISPPSRDSAVQIARLWLPGGATVEYAITPVRAIRQHIVMLAGRLDFTLGDRRTALNTGDCLFAVVDRPSKLHAPGPGPAEYLVVQESL